MVAGAATGVTTVDAAKRGAGSKSTARAGVAGRTPGAKLMAKLTGKVGVNGREKTTPACSIRGERRVK